MEERKSNHGVIKVTREEIAEACRRAGNLPTGDARDEMAIPSYLHWNPLVRWVVWRRHEIIMDLGRFEPGMEVLDFGCGPGVLLPSLCATGASVSAIDLFPDVAKSLCEARRLPVRFRPTLTQVENDSLDTVIAAEVLEHFENGLSELLSEMKRALKPDGRLLVSLPVEGVLYKLGRLIAGFGGKGHYHHHRGREIERFIGRNGFTLTRKRGIPHKWAPILYIVCEFRSTSTS